MIITYDKRVSNDARNAEAAAKLESHVNVEVGRERGADAKQQQEEVGKQDHEAPAKPTKRKMYMCIWPVKSSTDAGLHLKCGRRRVPVGHGAQHQRAKQKAGHVDGLRRFDQAALVTHQAELIVDRDGERRQRLTEIF